MPSEVLVSAVRWRDGIAIFLLALLTGCWALKQSPLDRELVTAVSSSDVAAVQRLIKQVKAQGEPVGFGPYRKALESVSSSNPASIEVLRLVLAAGPKRRSIGQVTPERAVDATFPPSARGARTWVSAVEIVTMLRCPEAVKVLLDAGLTVRSEGSTNAMVYAIWNRIDRIPEMLVEAGADVNGTGNLGPSYTPLEAAQEVKDQGRIAWLRARGAR